MRLALLLPRHARGAPWYHYASETNGVPVVVEGSQPLGQHVQSTRVRVHSGDDPTMHSVSVEDVWANECVSGYARVHEYVK